MWQKMVVMLFVLPSVVFADKCPQAGEAIKTAPYAKTYKCAAASIVVEGETNPEEYETCLGDVPAAKEAAYYISSGQPRRPLPSVKSLFSKTDRFIQTKVWMVSVVKCQEPNTITVRYWGGGNCSSCAQSVQYIFNKNGALTETRLAK